MTNHVIASGAWTGARTGGWDLGTGRRNPRLVPSADASRPGARRRAGRSARHRAARLVLLALVAGCSDRAGEGEAAAAAVRPAGAEAARPMEVVVRTRDYAFEAPDTIESGPVQFRLLNQGPDFHHIQLVRLEGGRTVEELLEHTKPHGPLPEWAVEVGGPNTPGAPGEQTSATVQLEPGEYAMICIIPAADGQPHYSKGMVRPLTVIPASGSTAVMPAADVTIVLNDYSFMTIPEVTAGRHTIRFENRAEQSHEVVFARLEPGRTVEELLQFLQKPEGTPPGKLIGGITGIEGGAVNQATLEFEPGEYVLICFLPDEGDGKPHFVHGMVRRITVR